MPEVVGFEAALYYNSGTGAAPVWVEIARCRDVTVGRTKAEVDVSRRQSSNRLRRGGLKDASFTFQYLYTTGEDSVFDDLMAAFDSGATTQFRILDQPTGTGAEGLEMWGEVMDMSYGQPLEDAQLHDFAVSATGVDDQDNFVDPAWVTLP